MILIERKEFNVKFKYLIILKIVQGRLTFLHLSKFNRNANRYALAYLL